MEFFAHDARIELINGEIINMAPIGNQHMSVVDQLTKRLVIGAGDDAIVRVQGSVRLDNFSEPEPDLLLLRPRSDFYANASAGPDDVMLLIEASESSLRYDREVKLPLYSHAGIPEVWIVDINAKQLTRYSNPSDGRWINQDSPSDLDHLSPETLNHITFDLSQLFS